MILLKNCFYLKYANSNLWHSVAYLWHFWVPNDLNVLFMPSDDMYSPFPSIWYTTSHGYSIIMKTVAWRHKKNVMTSQKRIFRKRHLAISSINGFLISFLASVFINIQPFRLYWVSEMRFFAARGALVTSFNFSYSLWESPSQELSSGTSYDVIA